MSDLDRFLKSEYRDWEFRRYELTRSQGSWRRFLVKILKFPPLRQVSGRLTLPGNASRTWRISGFSWKLTCQEGVLWLTKTGDGSDYFLNKGQTMYLEVGKWVVQALEPATVLVYPAKEKMEVSHGKAIVLPLLQRL